MWDVYQKKWQRSADFGWFECFLMFDKGGTWHTTFFNLLFTLHFPSCPPSKFFAISPPPSTVHVESLGKGIQQHVLHQETQFGANFLADSDRSCWISSGWWPVRILFSSFRETKTPCHTRGASPVFLGEWQPTNQPLPHVVLSNRIRPARHYLSNALGGQRVMRLRHLRSFPGHWKRLWVNEICCFNLKEKPAEICSRAFFLYLKHLNFSSLEINWN